ncbi:hypothetical protein ACLB2K_041006 [Fragaria x ananassa]
MDLEVSWKSKCERTAMAGQRLFREGEVYKQPLKGAYTKRQDELSRLGCQAGWINEAAMRKWYAEKNAAKVAWEQMTPEQRKQAEISRSLAKQHEAWRATLSLFYKVSMGTFALVSNVGLLALLWSISPSRGVLPL